MRWCLFAMSLVSVFVCGYPSSPCLNGGGGVATSQQRQSIVLSARRLPFFERQPYKYVEIKMGLSQSYHSCINMCCFYVRRTSTWRLTTIYIAQHQPFFVVSVDGLCVVNAHPDDKITPTAATTTNATDLRYLPLYQRRISNIHEVYTFYLTYRKINI